MENRSAVYKGKRDLFLESMLVLKRVSAEMATSVKGTQLFRLVANEQDLGGGRGRGMRFGTEQCKLLDVGGYSELYAKLQMNGMPPNKGLRPHCQRCFKSLLTREAVLAVLCFLPCVFVSFYETVNQTELDQPGKRNQLKLFLLNINFNLDLLSSDTNA